MARIPLRYAATAAACALALAACAKWSTKDTAATSATLTGAIASPATASRIDEKMDDGDRRRAGNALESTPTGRASSWKNPGNSNTYTFTPTRTTETGSGPCRDFTVVGTIESKAETVNGTACRQSDGTWKTKG
jgi:surface antigen